MQQADRIKFMIAAPEIIHTKHPHCKSEIAILAHCHPKKITVRKMTIIKLLSFEIILLWSAMGFFKGIVS
jgi:hypothetical protein